MDYALVKWRHPPEVTPYLTRFMLQQVLRVLDEKLVHNLFFRPKCVEVAAKVLQGQASAWVKYQLNLVDGPVQVLNFAYALTRCLPAAEALLLAALGTLSEKALAEHITCLRYLARNGPLDWIEMHCCTLTNVPRSYGVACAALGITWDRVHRWLAAGRPWSLIALDALVNCSTTSKTQNRSPWLREHLQAPLTLQLMDEALLAYVTLDSVPRTEQAVRFIQSQWPQIVKTTLV